MCAVNVIAAVADTANPRMYWYTVKRRNAQLFTNCKQLKGIDYSYYYETEE